MPIHFQSPAQGSLVGEADVNFDILRLSEWSLVSSTVEVRWSLSSGSKTALGFELDAALAPGR